MTRLVLLALTVLLFAAIAGQTQSKLMCDGKTIRIDKRTAMARLSKDCRACKSYILNRAAIDFVKPAYPDEAKKDRISGAVEVQITVNEDGTVQSTVPAGGPPLLSQAAIEAIRKTHFKRLILDCRPAKYTGIFIVNFPPR
jgi:TonB family protein